MGRSNTTRPQASAAGGTAEFPRRARARWQPGKGVRVWSTDRNKGKAKRTNAANRGYNHAWQFTLQGTNTYLLGRGPSRLLIDTGQGEPAWSTALRSLLASENATVSTALITHWHPDHTRGIPDLRALCPGVKVYKHDPALKGEEGEESGSGTGTGSGVWQDGAVEDGQVFRVEGATVRAVHTPGHTTDHMCFVLEEENALFMGDNVLGHGTTVFEELVPYMNSLKRMMACGAKRGYPGHGPVVENPKGLIELYLEHRKEREEEVLWLLRSGDGDGRVEAEGEGKGKDGSYWTPKGLTVAMYSTNLPEELMLSAVNGVSQVLLKLEGEGRTVHEKSTGLWRAASSSDGTKHVL